MKKLRLRLEGAFSKEIREELYLFTMAGRWWLAYAFAPGKKLAHGPRIGAPGVRVTDVGREELQELDADSVAGGRNNGG